MWRIEVVDEVGALTSLQRDLPSLEKHKVNSRSRQQGKIKGATLPLNAIGPDATAMALDDVFGDGQPQSGAPTAARPVGLIESLEDTRHIISRDAYSGVAHLDDNFRAVPSGG